MIEKEVVVIGAGFAGLGSAKSYLACAPATDLLILESLETLGGVWSRERIYPDLRTNNQLGTFSYPSFDFPPGKYGVNKGEFMPGMSVHQYMCDYADEFDLTRRIKFQQTLLTAEKQADKTWLLEVLDKPSGSTYQIKTSKMIVATSLTSQPSSVHYGGEEVFGAPLFRTSQLADRGVEVSKLTRDEDKHITVVGGSKGAYDAVWMFAHRGFKVNWIIRKSGYGATWMARSHVVIGPLGSFWLEKLTAVRILTFFSPCYWGGVEGFGWVWSALHRTWLGRAFLKTFWRKLSDDTLEQSGITKDKELRKLIPDESALWYATSLAILNYKTPIHDFVTSGQVKIYREDLTHLTPKTVHLSDGTALPSPGGFVAATHWQWAPNLTFRPSATHSDLGIPSTSYTPEQKAFWQALDEDADKEIFKKLPMLTSAPQKGHNLKNLNEPKAVESSAEADSLAKLNETGPFRLYRFIAPPGLTAQGDRSIVFAGYTAILLGRIRDEVAGVWMYAYLNNKLDIDVDKVHWEAALHNRWSKRRCPYGFGARFPDFVFEQIPYFDLLLQDLGLPVRRKGGLIREIFESYGPEDYRGIAEEWLAKQKSE